MDNAELKPCQACEDAAVTIGTSAVAYYSASPEISKFASALQQAIRRSCRHTAPQDGSVRVPKPLGVFRTGTQSLQLMFNSVEEREQVIKTLSAAPGREHD